MGLSVIFIIARGIEFGDLKSQQWLGSILMGFFSSVLLTQPLKVSRCYFLSESNVMFAITDHIFGHLFRMFLSQIG